MPDPEQLARVDIDRLLMTAGWLVQDRSKLNLYAGRGIAIREVSIPGAGEADYLLVADRKAIGIIEAKLRGTTLSSTEIQTAKYAQDLPGHIGSWRLPLPMLYESTGIETRVTNLLEPESRNRNVFSFHRPETLVAWVKQAVETLANGVGHSSLAGRFALLPTGIADDHLWPTQLEAITNLKQALNLWRSILLKAISGSFKTTGMDGGGD